MVHFQDQITLVLQLRQVLALLVENLQPLEVVVLLQMQGQQLGAEVELQEQILRQILDPDFGPLHHQHSVLALHHPLQSRDQQLASKQYCYHGIWCVCKLLTSPFLRQL